MTALAPLPPALAHLGTLRQFIVCKLVPRDNGKTDKIPCDYATGAVGVDAHDPKHWTDWETAQAAAMAWGPMQGEDWRVGLTITATDDVWVIDIDGALTPQGTWSDLARQLVAALPGAAVEVSQSGKGLHIWGRGPVPAHSKKNVALHIELYTERRFIALGRWWDAIGDMSQPCPAIATVAAAYFPPRATAGEVPDEGPRADWRGPTDDEEIIRRALQSRSTAATFGADRATFADLWNANAEALARAYPPDRNSADAYDRSSADAALAQHLAYWVGCDQARMERLMRRSVLVRDKWERADYLPRTIATACARQRDVVQDKPPTVAPVTGGTFLQAAYGALPATIEGVYDALRSPDSGVRFGWDTFQDQLMVAGAGSKWREVRDVDFARLRAEFGRRGFKPITAEIMKSAVILAAEDNQFDSALQWAETLRWDGKPRIDALMPVYFGSEDTPYTRAAGAYLCTAMAGRLVKPGCQADMVVVLVGMQGKRKTSAVRALAPEERFFAEIDLKKIDGNDLSRQIRGKLIGEIAELRGLAGRDRESVKAWVTRREERWIPKFREFETAYPRRLVFIGTTNEREFLDDSTGERRWLPLSAGAADVEAIERDREQLWAEGLERFRMNGVEWQQAEALAAAEHEAFKIADPWSERIADWLDAPHGLARTRGAVTMAEVLQGALLIPPGSSDRRAQLRAGSVLRGLGFTDGQCWIEGRNRRAWRRAEFGASPSPVPSPGLALPQGHKG